MQDSNFTVGDGEFFVMLGPSGCGKTTTLRMIAGLELPTSGRILLGGEDVTFKRAARARHRLRLPALRALSAHERAQQHRLPAEVPGRAARPRSGSRVEETARFLRIDHLLDQPVSRLAGGDRQRVALGRAIVRRPKAFLMDEPLGTLDTEFRDLMVRELRELHNRIEATTVYVTHDQLEAMAMADKIAVMNHGVIEQFGTPQEIYDRPATHVRRRFHRLAADELPRTSAAGLQAAATTRPRQRRRHRACRRSREDRAEADLALGVRPEHIRFDDASRAARRGLRRRISRHHADRHGQYRRTARSRRGSPPTSPARAGETVGLALPRRAPVALRQGVRPRDPHRALHEGGRHG